MTVKVIQADRDAAWPFRPPCHSDTERELWDTGCFDKLGLIQAFATARLQSTEALRAENERLREAGEALVNFTEHDRYCAAWGLTVDGPMNCTCGLDTVRSAWAAALTTGADAPNHKDIHHD